MYLHVLSLHKDVQQCTCNWLQYCFLACLTFCLVALLEHTTQVLSSRLMPTGHRERETDESTTQLFRRTFLECGGLKLVINVLQKNALPSDVDLTVRQDCYAISLSLAR